MPGTASLSSPFFYVRPRGVRHYASKCVNLLVLPEAKHHQSFRRHTPGPRQRLPFLNWFA